MMTTLIISLINFNRAFCISDEAVVGLYTPSCTGDQATFVSTCMRLAQTDALRKRRPPCTKYSDHREDQLRYYGEQWK
eukprot:1448316-Amphidinium_carterae.1